jgi:hypothetical protein
VRVEAMDVSRTRSTVLRALGRNDETETARSRGARTGGRLGRLARRRRVERVTHHLQQLIVVVLRHRARRYLHRKRARSDLRVDVHDKSEHVRFRPATAWAKL